MNNNLDELKRLLETIENEYIINVKDITVRFSIDNNTESVIKYTKNYAHVLAGYTVIHDYLFNSLTNILKGWEEDDLITRDDIDLLPDSYDSFLKVRHIRLINKIPDIYKTIFMHIRYNKGTKINNQSETHEHKIVCENDVKFALTELVAIELEKEYESKSNKTSITNLFN